jgi:hypothetical protein
VNLIVDLLLDWSQEVMMQKDTQYKAVKDNESKLLSLIEMFKKQLKEIEKNSEDKQKKLQYAHLPIHHAHARTRTHAHTHTQYRTHAHTH